MPPKSFYTHAVATTRARMRHQLSAADLVGIPIENLYATDIEVDDTGGTITIHTRDAEWLREVIRNSWDCKDLLDIQTETTNEPY